MMQLEKEKFLKLEDIKKLSHFFNFGSANIENNAQFNLTSVGAHNLLTKLNFPIGTYFFQLHYRAENPSIVARVKIDREEISNIVIYFDNEGVLFGRKNGKYKDLMDLEQRVLRKAKENKKITIEELIRLSDVNKIRQHSLYCQFDSLSLDDIKAFPHFFRAAKESEQGDARFELTEKDAQMLIAKSDISLPVGTYFLHLYQEAGEEFVAIQVKMEGKRVERLLYRFDKDNFIVGNKGKYKDIIELEARLLAQLNESRQEEKLEMLIPLSYCLPHMRRFDFMDYPILDAKMLHWNMQRGYTPISLGDRIRIEALILFQQEECHVSTKNGEIISVMDITYEQAKEQKATAIMSVYEKAAYKKKIEAEQKENIDVDNLGQSLTRILSAAGEMEIEKNSKPKEEKCSIM